jgi:hypothetical protein
MRSEDPSLSSETDSERYLASDWLRDLTDIVEYEALSFATQYSLTKGVKVYGEEAMRVTKD